MADIVIAGASGFLGTHLSQELQSRGHRVTALTRGDGGPGRSAWDPYAGRVDQDVIDAADVVVNLAGSPTAGNPHSKGWSRALMRSRVTTTSVLAQAIARAGGTPAFLAGNGISYYGDHGQERLTEASESRGEAFLTRVTRAWQEAADPAVEAGARVAVLRTAPVLDIDSAPLKQLAILFRLGMGAPLGDGHQYFPVISRRDWVGAVVHLAEHPDVSGPVNLCAPGTPTNAEFTAALAQHVRRWHIPIGVPAPLLRMGAGALAPELLGSVRAVPEVLLTSGYIFADPDIDSVLSTALAD